MGVNSNQYLQGINQTTGTGAPVHSAVAGDRYTDTATGTTYQYTTSWQTVSYSAGGLTYFTEAQSTASPNATVNVDSLTAVATSTNADFSIVPKGTGAVLASIPDGLGAGGNKRGAYAVDLQRLRNSATEVASGDYSTLIGGWRTKATGSYSTVLGGAYGAANSDYSIAGGYNNSVIGIGAFGVGYQNSTNGTACFVAGQTNSANTQYDSALGVNNSVTSAIRASFAVGTNNTITSGYGSMALGGYNTLDGYASCALGHDNTGSAYSTMLGRNGWSNGTPKMVYSGNGWVIGDNQKSNLMLNARTTGATPTTLVVNQASGATANALNQLILPNNSCFSVKGRIVGKKSASTDVGVWDIDFIIVRGTTAATTVLKVNTVNMISNDASWGTPTVTANTTLGCPTVQVTGLAATNIQWTFAPESVEVIYA